MENSKAIELLIEEVLENQFCDNKEIDELSEAAISADISDAFFEKIKMAVLELVKCRVNRLSKEEVVNSAMFKACRKFKTCIIKKNYNQKGELKKAYNKNESPIEMAIKETLSAEEVSDDFKKMEPVIRINSDGEKCYATNWVKLTYCYTKSVAQNETEEINLFRHMIMGEWGGRREWVDNKNLIWYKQGVEPVDEVDEVIAQNIKYVKDRTSYM